MSDAAESPSARARLEVLVGLLADEVCFLDAEGVVVGGTHPVATAGCRFLDVVEEGQRQEASVWLDRVRHAESVAPLSARVAGGDGPVVVWRGRRVGTRGDLLLVGRELTGAELGLRHSEEALVVEMLAEHEALFSVDRDGRVLEVSAALRRLIGSDDVETEPYEIWRSRVDPRDLEAMDPTWRRMLATGEPRQLQFSYRYHDPERGLRWLHVELRSLLDDGGSLWRVIGRLVDVTEEQERVAALEQSREALERAVRSRTARFISQAEELRRTNVQLVTSEHRLETAQRIAHVGSWSWSVEEGAVEWSAETFRIFGHEPHSFPPTYQGFLDQVTDEDRALVAERVSRSAETGQAYEVEHGVVRPDGTRRIVKERAEVSTDPSGALWMVGVCQDVTELHSARDRLVTAIEERDALLREVHHRVKNNLQIVSSLLYLRGASVPAEARAPFEDSRVRVQAMALVHETLYESGRFDRVALHTYLDRLLDGTQQAWLGDGANIVLERALEPAWLELDRASPLGLLLVELVSNALKHAFPSGGGRVRVVLRWTTDDELELRVADDGVGISQDPPAVSGLGMSLVSGLVDQLGGSLDVEVQDGTCCRFRLPVTGGREKGAPEARG